MQQRMRYLLSVFAVACVQGNFQETNYDSNLPQFPPRSPQEPLNLEVKKFFSRADRSMHSKFFSDVMNLILEEAVFFNEGNPQPPTNWRSPKKLKKTFDFSVGEEGTDHEDLLRILRAVIHYSPKPSHPFMLSKRVAGLDPYALIGDFTAVTMSSFMIVYQSSPVWTLMEREVVKQLGKLVGWKNPEGVFTSGAGAANSLAVAMALQRKLPELRNGGYAAHGYPFPIIFVSEDASYAFLKSALYQGIPKEGIVKVKVDDRGRMGVEDLKRLISIYERSSKENGYVLTAVVATIGTPLYGAIDPVDEIAEICRDGGMWFHVDADKGAGALFHPSQKFQNLQESVGKADSFTFGTWAFAMPYVTTVLVTKESDRLQKSFGLRASYLWTGMDMYNISYDVGDHTIQTSRRPEVAKLWFSWKARGKEGYETLTQLQYSNLETFIKLLEEDPELELVFPEYDVPQVGFWWIPWASWDKKNGTTRKIVSSINRQIQAKLLVENIMQITIAHGGQRNPDFLLVSLTNTALSRSDFEYIIKAVKRYGQQAYYGSSNITMEYSRPAVSNCPGGTAPLKGSHEELFRSVFKMILEEGLFFLRKDSPYKFEQPESLLSKFDLSLDNTASTNGGLLSAIKSTITFSPRIGHPYFMYHLIAGLDPYTVAADYVASALSTPMITYEDSPVFTLMQDSVLAALRQRVFGSSIGDGIIADGGSMANQFAIAIARRHKFLAVKEGGFHAIKKKLILYMSEDAHYSTTKGALFQGYGKNNLINIKASRYGRMDVAALEERVKQDVADPESEPFLVVITTGTTVYGAIDNVEEIIKVCERYNLWCHVDGMFGGFAIMSDTFREKYKGVERADSWGADLHKLMGSAFTMTALVSRHEGIFKATFGTQDPIDFMNNPDSPYNKDLYDHGDKHWQVDKRNNLFKFWFLWKAKGRIGLGAHVDRIIHNSKYITQQLHKRPGFLPVIEDFDLTNVCFFYLPQWLRNYTRDSPEFTEQVGHVSSSLEERLTKAGIMKVVAQNRRWSGGDTPSFLKFLMMGSALREVDIDYLLDAVEFFGKDIKSK